MSSINRSLAGKIAMVTGANSGIGFVIADELALRGAHVVMVCRDKSRGEIAMNKIRGRNGSVELMIADFASLDSVRNLARNYEEKHDRLHLLVNNAGAVMGARRTTVDGFEMTFEVNYLSHFLLTNLLLDTLKASAPSRIVNVSSDAHTGYPMDFADLQGEIHYSSMRAYGQSKLAQVLFTRELARRLEGSGVTVNAVHPGAVRTNFGSGAGFLGYAIKIVRPFMLSPEKGADTPVYVATSPELEKVSGKYFTKRKIVEPSKEAQDPDDAAKLWQLSEKLTKSIVA